MRSFFIDFWKRVGFTMTSSSFLVRRMVSCIDFTGVEHIVELGAGTGVLTREIIRIMPEGALLSVFEIDPIQTASLRKEFDHISAVTIYSHSAVDIETIFLPESIDVVISTLPLGSISHPWVGHILEATRNILKSAWQFIQYQYWMVNRRDVKKYFTIESTIFEPRNFWPAWIYRARKTK